MATDTTTKAPKSGPNFAHFGSYGAQYAVVDNILILRIPMTKAAVNDARPSKTGKNLLVANSGGWTGLAGGGLPEGTRVNLGVMVPPARASD